MKKQADSAESENHMETGHESQRAQTKKPLSGIWKTIPDLTAGLLTDNGGREAESGCEVQKTPDKRLPGVCMETQSHQPQNEKKLSESISPYGSSVYILG